MTGSLLCNKLPMHSGLRTYRVLLLVCLQFVTNIQVHHLCYRPCYNIFFFSNAHRAKPHTPAYSHPPACSPGRSPSRCESVSGGYLLPICYFAFICKAWLLPQMRSVLASVDNLCRAALVCRTCPQPSDFYGQKSLHDCWGSAIHPHALLFCIQAGVHISWAARAHLRTRAAAHAGNSHAGGFHAGCHRRDRNRPAQGQCGCPCLCLKSVRQSAQQHSAQSLSLPVVVKLRWTYGTQ